MGKCVNHCRCGKHQQHNRTAASKNTTFIPGRLAYSSTYGAQQRERIRLAAAERGAAGKRAGFDFDDAIIRLRVILDELYGPT